MWAGYLSLLILLGIIAIRFLGDRLYDYPDSPQIAELPKNSIVACLAGAKGRVEAASALFAKGVGSYLIIVGAGPKSSLATLYTNPAVRSELQKMSPQRLEKIIVETESRNTVENAFAVDRILQQYKGVNDVILITSNYHMRRAQLVIESQASREMKIIPVGVESEFVQKDNWWQTWLGIEITVREYCKLVLASFFVPKLKYF